MLGPQSDCRLCPRLFDLRQNLQETHPDFHNAPVQDFGDLDARLLIVGLAPGLHGANRTGVPFTGDGAGKILYKALLEVGLAYGAYKEEKDNGLTLQSCRITNAVHCLPPQNKPSAFEINTCRHYLKDLIYQMTSLQAILCLGRIAHESVMKCMDARSSFRHHESHQIGKYRVFDSYHCSRYNISTKRLTYEMFRDVVADIQVYLRS